MLVCALDDDVTLEVTLDVTLDVVPLGQPHSCPRSEVQRGPVGLVVFLGGCIGGVGAIVPGYTCTCTAILVVVVVVVVVDVVATTETREPSSVAVVGNQRHVCDL
jgi:hypothetical protein